MSHARAHTHARTHARTHQSLDRQTAGGNLAPHNRRAGTWGDGCETTSREGLCCLENYDLTWSRLPPVYGQQHLPPGAGTARCVAEGNCVERGDGWDWEPVQDVPVRVCVCVCVCVCSHACMCVCRTYWCAPQPPR